MECLLLHDHNYEGHKISYRLRPKQHYNQRMWQFWSRSYMKADLNRHGMSNLMPHLINSTMHLKYCGPNYIFYGRYCGHGYNVTNPLMHYSVTHIITHYNNVEIVREGIIFAPMS